MRSLRFSTVLPIAALFLLSLVASCRQTPSDPPPAECTHGIIHVHAQDGEGHPINDAGVTLSADNFTTRHASTNADGNAGFDGLHTGTYLVTITKDGYTVNTEHVTLTCDQEFTLTRTLTHTTTTGECHSGRIVLILRDSATHVAIASGNASLWLGSHLISTKTISANGTVWEGLVPGRYSFSVTREGYPNMEFGMDSLGCDENRTVDRNWGALHSNTTCTGRVYITVNDSSTHHTLTGATLIIYKNGVQIATATSGADAVRFGDLCPGSYRVTINKDGYTQGVIEFSIDADGVRTFTISLLSTNHDCCNGVAEVQVVDADGHAIAGATVYLKHGGVVARTATTSSTGGVRFGELCEGEYGIAVVKDGYQNNGVEFTETCNLTHGYTVTLTANHTDECHTTAFILHVADSLHHDTNLQGATVTIRIDGNNDIIAHGTTTDGGNYSATGLSGHKTYIITISKDGYNVKTWTIQITDCREVHETLYLGSH